jgi:hypothetical protein
MVRAGTLILALLAASLTQVTYAETNLIALPAGSSYNVPVTSMKGARFISTLQQQYDFSCGSAAVATLLTHHYGWDVSEADVFQHMFERGDQARIRAEGFSMLDMKRYLDTKGFQSEGVEATLDQLASANIPAIALINENGYAHFVVIKGLRDNRVVLGDPAMGTRVLEREQFEQLWTNGILLVVRTSMDLAQFNRDEDWRIRPSAPVANGLGRNPMETMLLMRGPMDF